MWLRLNEHKNKRLVAGKSLKPRIFFLSFFFFFYYFFYWLSFHSQIVINFNQSHFSGLYFCESKQIRISNDATEALKMMT